MIKKTDIIFLKKLTFRKVFNAVKIYLSYIFSIIFKFSKRWGYPVSISIEPTATCNLHCPECPSGTDELTRFKGNIDFSLFRKVIDETAPYLLNLILYFQGEPFFNKDIFKLIEYASVKKKIYSVTSTNGHFLTAEIARKIVLSGLDKIIISLDGTTQETYERYRRGGDLETVLSGIRNLISQREKLQSQTPIIVIQFLVFKFNEHEIEPVKELCKDLKVDRLELKSAQIYDFEKNSDLIPDIEKYSRYKKNANGKFEIKSKLKNHCRRLWEANVITNKGEVLPCCFDKDAKYSAGNVKEYKFSEIKNNIAAVSFREKLLKSRKQIDICRNCTEGLKK